MVEQVPDPEHLFRGQSVVGPLNLDDARRASGGVPQHQVGEAAAAEPAEGTAHMGRSESENVVEAEANRGKWQGGR